jgi:hypothetical protein
MVKLLLGIWSEEGGVVKYSTPNFTKKEANQLLDNVLFSANIYGQSSSKKDIAFTLPIMYLPGYSHGRIYFKFSSKTLDQPKDPLIIDVLSHSPKDFPISFFCTFKKLNDDNNNSNAELDDLIWSFLNTEMVEADFNILINEINLLIQKL